MEETGLTQAQIATATRGAVDQGRVSRILNGSLPEVSFYVMSHVLIAAGLSIDWCVRAPTLAADEPAPSSSVLPARPA